MAAPRFLNLEAGRIRQLIALLVSTGASDGEKIVATSANGKLDDSIMGAATTGNNVVLKTGADGRIDSTTLPVGIGADTKIMPASEALAANDLVNVWNDAGAEKARKADATAEGKEAAGFVKAAVVSGQPATVYFEGRMTGLAGLTPGARQYLSAASAGAAIAAPPAASGNIVQLVGSAVSATEIDFEKSDPVTLA